MKHAPPVVIVLLQRSEHGNISFIFETCSVSCHRLMTVDIACYTYLRYETCSVSCHHLMTTVRAW